MQKQNHNLRAYTLIELLILVAIIGIMSAVMLVSLGTNRTKKEVSLAGGEVLSAFREAQNYALTGSQIIAGSSPCRLALSWSGSSYTTAYWYKDGGGNCTQSTALRAYTLKNGVAFGNADTFYFSLPYAHVSFGGASKAAVLTKDAFSSVVCVYAEGLITENVGNTCP